MGTDDLQGFYQQILTPECVLELVMSKRVTSWLLYLIRVTGVSVRVWLFPALSYGLSGLARRVWWQCNVLYVLLVVYVNFAIFAVLLLCSFVHGNLHNVILIISDLILFNNSLTCQIICLLSAYLC